MSRLRFSADLQSPFQDESYEGKGPAAQITWRLAKMAQLAMFDISPHNLTRAWRRAAIHAADANISDLATCLWPGYKWLQNYTKLEIPRLTRDKCFLKQLRDKLKAPKANRKHKSMTCIICIMCMRMLHTCAMVCS